jgi:hypothetical protein
LKKIYTLREAAESVKETYSRVWHVYAYGRLRPPLRVGRTFAVTDADLAKLRAYFETKKDSHERTDDPDEGSLRRLRAEADAGEAHP